MVTVVFEEYNRNKRRGELKRFDGKASRARVRVGSTHLDWASASVRPTSSASK